MRIAFFLLLFFLGAFGFLAWRSLAMSGGVSDQSSIGAVHDAVDSPSSTGNSGGIGVRAAARAANNAAMGDGSAVPSFDLFENVDVTLASPQLTPDDVVQRQMEALQASAEDPDQFEACYSLAAPSNRALTGPIENFRRMIDTPAYRAMIYAPTWQVGIPVIENDLAIVVVSVLDESNSPFAYRFLLQRQREEPYVDCWMTLAVQAAMPSGVPMTQPAAGDTSGDRDAESGEVNTETGDNQSGIL